MLFRSQFKARTIPFGVQDTKPINNKIERVKLDFWLLNSFVTRGLRGSSPAQISHPYVTPSHGRSLNASCCACLNAKNYRALGVTE